MAENEEELAFHEHPCPKMNSLRFQKPAGKCPCYSLRRSGASHHYLLSWGHARSEAAWSDHHADFAQGVVVGVSPGVPNDSIRTQGPPAFRGVVASLQDGVVVSKREKPQTER